MSLYPRMSIEEVKTTPHSPEEFYTYLIERLRLLGFKVRTMTPYQFRVEKRLDVYPVNMRWHDIDENERGGYDDIFKFVTRFFKPYGIAKND